jgi:hypothetical protein
MAGTLTISTLSDGTSSTSATDIVKGSARAWVNFNGTGTVAIRASYNVSSITDNGAGDYTINFTNAMPDTNYATVGNCATTTDSFGVVGPVQATTSQVEIGTYNFATFTDFNFVSVAVYR